MIYHTYVPHPDLAALVKFYWTLEVPFDPANEKQKIIPDGCVEMTFNFADGIKRYTSENEYIVHPRVMVMGQRTKSYLIEPLGNVDSFAVCFYPYGFANFVKSPLQNLVDQELPLHVLFGEEAAHKLERNIMDADSTKQRIHIIETFLLNQLQENSTVEHMVISTVDALMDNSGSKPIHNILSNNPSQRRTLERNFRKRIGISPKQLGRVIRLQTALQMMFNNDTNLTHIAYESDYFDQAHFIKDFKEFTGITPKELLKDKEMTLSSLFYK
jgi:AraC-like DNA-binding protein